MRERETCRRRFSLSTCTPKIIIIMKKKTHLPFTLFRRCYNIVFYNLWDNHQNSFFSPVHKKKGERRRRRRNWATRPRCRRHKIAEQVLIVRLSTLSDSLLLFTQESWWGKRRRERKKKGKERDLWYNVHVCLRYSCCSNTTSSSSSSSFYVSPWRRRWVGGCSCCCRHHGTHTIPTLFFFSFFSLWVVEGGGRRRKEEDACKNRIHQQSSSGPSLHR